MTTHLINKTVFNVLEDMAPLHLAYDWDNVGLQVGSYEKQVKKVMITLDVLESVVDEAIEKKVDLIVAHHPLLFKPLQNITVDDGKGRLIEKLIKHDITVYATHTNLDIATGGVNDILANMLKLEQVSNLIDLPNMIATKSASHVEGIGRIGLLNEPMPLQEMVDHVKSVFALPAVRVTGDLKKQVKKVAVLGGSGEKFINEATKAGADVYITGDMTFHVAQEAMDMGLAVIDAGHYIEKHMKETLKEYLQAQFPTEGLVICVSEVETDPFQFL